MKKLFKISAAIALALAFCVSVTACTFIDSGALNSGSNGNSGENNGSNAGNSNYTSSTVAGDVGNAEIVYRKVRFNEGTVDYTATEPMSLTDAVKKVERSAVALETDGGSGSGVIIDIELTNEKGEAIDSGDIVYVLTCHHMISDKGNVTVFFPDADCGYENDSYAFAGVIGGSIKDNSSNAVKLIGGDLNSDIALLSVDLSKLPKSKEALSDTEIAEIKAAKVKVAGSDYNYEKGEEVFSIGNPTGSLPGTVSCGKISYLERVTTVSDIGSMSLLQIDVTSNPGNSGGGLYNLYGELIGITNAGNTSYQNMNFAIPLKLASDDSTEQTLKTVNHGFKYCAEMLLSTASENNYGCVPGSKQKFGFSITEEDSPTGSYIVVSSVTEGSLAYAAGLRSGDNILKVSVNGEEYKEVSTVAEFSAILNTLNIGDYFTISGKRLGSGYSRRYEDFYTEKITCSQFWFCFISQN